MITLNQYLMGRPAKYADEYSDEIRLNAQRLLIKVNALLSAIGYEDVEISSGWRPKTLNAQVNGAAKHSHHITGNAVDIIDTDKKIAQAILKQEFITKNFLESFDLYMENPEYSKTWVHLQDKPTKSGKRIFIP